MTITLLCGRCTLPYDAPTDEAGTVQITMDTLTTVQRTEGRSLIPMCPACSQELFSRAESLPA